MYSVTWSEKAKKELKKLDKQVQKKIFGWIVNNLDGCSNPYTLPQFKKLKGDKSDYIRYRIGVYRIICSVANEELLIQVVTIGHRREVYK